MEEDTPDVGALLSSLGGRHAGLDKIARASGMDPETMQGTRRGCGSTWTSSPEVPDEYRSFLEKQQPAAVDPNKAFGPAGGAGGTGADPKTSPPRRRRGDGAARRRRRRRMSPL